MVDDFFIVVGLCAFVVGLVAVVKGSIPSMRIPSRAAGGLVLGGSLLAMLVGGSLASNGSLEPVPAPSESATPADDFVLEVPSPSPSVTRPPGVPPDAQEATVARHVDGDTLWLEGGTLPANAASSVRLVGMDAPEAGATYYSEASAFLRSEVPVGTIVFLLADREDTDRFGRFLRYLWSPSGELLNEKAVRHGFARALLVSPNDRYIGRIRAAEAEARREGRGIWAPAVSSPAARPQPPSTRPVLTTTAPGPAPTEPQAAANCDPSYPDFCIEPPPPDLDCGDIRRRFTVLQPDPHRFDGLPGQAGEPDGVGCESYS